MKDLLALAPFVLPGVLAIATGLYFSHENEVSARKLDEAAARAKAERRRKPVRFRPAAASPPHDRARP